MGTPLKVSDDLFAIAKEEAAAENRSITGQVEHWARIGRAVEAVLAHCELLGLKKAGEFLSPVFPRPDRRREVHDLLAGIVATTERTSAVKAIRASGQPVYSTDPDHPGRLVQVLPDGTRRPGHLEGRRFVPEPAKGAKRARGS